MLYIYIGRDQWFRFMIAVNTAGAVLLFKKLSNNIPEHIMAVLPFFTHGSAGAHTGTWNELISDSLKEIGRLEEFNRLRTTITERAAQFFAGLTRTDTNSVNLGFSPVFPIFATSRNTADSLKRTGLYEILGRDGNNVRLVAAASLFTSMNRERVAVNEGLQDHGLGAAELLSELNDTAVNEWGMAIMVDRDDHLVMLV